MRIDDVNFSQHRTEHALTSVLISIMSPALNIVMDLLTNYIHIHKLGLFDNDGEIVDHQIRAGWMQNDLNRANLYSLRKACIPFKWLGPERYR